MVSHSYSISATIKPHWCAGPAGNITTPILQLRKLRFSQVMYLCIQKLREPGWEPRCLSWQPWTQALTAQKQPRYILRPSLEFFIDVCVPPHHITVWVKNYPRPIKKNRSAWIKVLLPRATLSHGIALWVNMADLFICVPCGCLLGLPDCDHRRDSWLIYVLLEHVVKSL